MSFFRSGPLALLAASLAVASAAAQALEPERYRGPVDAPDVMGGHRSDRLLIKLDAGASIERRHDGWIVRTSEGRIDATTGRQLDRAGAASIRSALTVRPASAELAAAHGLDRWFILELPIGSDVPGLIAELSSRAGIGVARPEGIGGMLDLFPNDPSFSLQWGPHNTGQVMGGVTGVPGADIDLPGAWALHTGTDAITVAIIDTGVSNSHPDLNAKLVPGWNMMSNNSDTDDSFLISHGTHCAGIAAASTNNGVGIAGVSWGARIMPIKVLNFIGGGTEPDVADGIVWAVDHGAQVGSLSLGFPPTSDFLEDAVNYATDAGMLVIAATGNTAGAPIASPAKFPAVLAVGATNNQDLIASFTTTGPEMDVVAPGVDVYSTWDTIFEANTYSYQSGTSMACPHVAGLAALVWSVDPSRTNHEIRAIIESTTEDKGASGWDPIYGHGRVNARLAVEAALAARCEPADFNCDGVIDGADLGVLLGAWGTPDADLNDDGTTDGADLGILLGAWGA